MHSHKFYDRDQVFVLWNWKWMDDPGGEQDDPDPDNEEDHEVSPVDVALSSGRVSHQ